MPWLTILKYGLPVILVVGMLGVVYQAGYRASSAQCQIKISRLQESLSSLAAQQEKQNREAEQRMADAERSRQALSVELSTRVDNYNGLAMRLLNATHACTNNVSGTGSSNSPAPAVEGGYCSVAGFGEAVQRVLTACRADSIALDVLRSKPLCECAK